MYVFMYLMKWNEMECSEIFVLVMVGEVKYKFFINDVNGSF